MENTDFLEIKESILKILIIELNRQKSRNSLEINVSLSTMKRSINTLLQNPAVKKISSKEFDNITRDIIEDIIKDIRYVEKILSEYENEDTGILLIDNSDTTNDLNYGKYWTDRMNQDEHDTPGGYFDD